MVKISLLSGEESMTTEELQEEHSFSAMDLLEITQNSAIIDLFYEADIAPVSPFLAEVK